MPFTTPTADKIAQIIDRKTTSNGASLATLSLNSPLLVAFLRHPGCTFCRETLSDLAMLRSEAEAAGVRIVIVYHGRRGTIESLLARHQLSNVERLYDADLSLYRAFGLSRGSIKQVFGWKVWKRMFSGALRKHGIGWGGGDPWQMPGIFLIDQGQMYRSFRHRLISDRPPYESILSTLQKKPY